MTLIKQKNFVKFTTLLMTSICYVLVTSVKKLNKVVNAYLNNLIYWLNANKISLSVKKTEMVIFKSQQNK